MSKRFISTISILSLIVPDYARYGIACCMSGVGKAVMETKPLENAREISGAFFQGKRLVGPALVAHFQNSSNTLIQGIDPWLSGIIRDIRNRGKSKDDQVRLLNEEIHVHRQKLASNIQQLIVSWQKGKLREAQSALGEIILGYLADGLKISQALTYTESVLAYCMEQLAELQKSLSTYEQALNRADSTLTQSLLNTTEALTSSIIMRNQRIKNAEKQLGQDLRQWARAKAQYEACNEAIRLLDALDAFSQEQITKVAALKDHFRQVRSFAEEAQRIPPPCRGTASVIEEPVLDLGEVQTIIEDTLMYAPNDPPQEVLVELARVLKKLLGWPECSKDDIQTALNEFFKNRLQYLAELDMEKALAWKAKHDNRPSSVMGSELITSIQHRTKPWLQIVKAEIPDTGTVGMTVLEAMENVTAQFFREADLPTVNVIRKGGTPSEVNLLNVETGVHKEALRLWPTYERAFLTGPPDGFPFVPEVFLPKPLNASVGNNITNNQNQEVKITPGNGHHSDDQIAL